MEWPRAGGVADEWVTQLLRQGDAKVFQKYSQMKLTMKREALEKLNRLGNEMSVGGAQPVPETGVLEQLWNSLAQNAREWILEFGEML